VDNGLAGFGFWVRLVKGDVVAAGPVAALAGDAEDRAFAAVLGERAGNVADPGIVGFDATGRRFPRKILLRAVAIARGHRPLPLRVQPGHGQFVKPIAVPAEIHFVRVAGAVDPGNPRGSYLLIA